MLYQTQIAERSQVVGRAGLRETEGGGQVADAKLFLGEGFHDSEAGGIGESGEYLSEAPRRMLVRQPQLDAPDALRVDGNYVAGIERFEFGHFNSLDI